MSDLFVMEFHVSCHRYNSDRIMEMKKAVGFQSWKDQESISS